MKTNRCFRSQLWSPEEHCAGLIVYNFCTSKILRSCGDSGCPDRGLISITYTERKTQGQERRPGSADAQWVWAQAGMRGWEGRRPGARGPGARPLHTISVLHRNASRRRQGYRGAERGNMSPTALLCRADGLSEVSLSVLQSRHPKTFP